jgi:hypothetical protein
MRTTLTALRGLAVAMLLAGAACGDDGASQPDADTTTDAGIDANPDVTFTSYVLDLVLNQTAANTDPKPFADFGSLPDPDTNNPNAYEALFP